MWPQREIQTQIVFQNVLPFTPLPTLLHPFRERKKGGEKGNEKEKRRTLFLKTSNLFGFVQFQETSTKLRKLTLFAEDEFLKPFEYIDRISQRTRLNPLSFLSILSRRILLHTHTHRERRTHTSLSLSLSRVPFLLRYPFCSFSSS